MKTFCVRVSSNPLGLNGSEILTHLDSILGQRMAAGTVEGLSDGNYRIKSYDDSIDASAYTALVLAEGLLKIEPYEPGATSLYDATLSMSLGDSSIASTIAPASAVPRTPTFRRQLLSSAVMEDTESTEMFTIGPQVDVWLSEQEKITVSTQLSASINQQLRSLGIASPCEAIHSFEEFPLDFSVSVKGTQLLRDKVAHLFSELAMRCLHWGIGVTRDGIVIYPASLSAGIKETTHGLQDPEKFIQRQYFAYFQDTAAGSLSPKEQTEALRQRFPKEHGHSVACTTSPAHAASGCFWVVGLAKKSPRGPTDDLIELLSSPTNPLFGLYAQLPVADLYARFREEIFLPIKQRLQEDPVQDLCTQKQERSRLINAFIKKLALQTANISSVVKIDCLCNQAEIEEKMATLYGLAARDYLMSLTTSEIPRADWKAEFDVLTTYSPFLMKRPTERSPEDGTLVPAKDPIRQLGWVARQYGLPTEAVDEALSVLSALVSSLRASPLSCAGAGASATNPHRMFPDHPQLSRGEPHFDRSHDIFETLGNRW